MPFVPSRGAVWRPSKVCIRPNWSLPEQIFSIDFCAWMPNFPFIHLHTRSRGEKNGNLWLKARLLWLTEHITDRIPLGVTILKQTCTRLAIPGFITRVFSTFYFLSLPDNRHSLHPSPCFPPFLISSSLLSAPLKGLSVRLPVCKLAKAWILLLCSLPLLSGQDKGLHCQLVRLINILYGTRPDVFRRESTSHHAVGHWF